MAAVMKSKHARVRARPKALSKGVTFDTVRDIAETLPDAEESTSYGTPAFKVKGKLFARFHQGGEALVVSVDFEQREEMMKTSPEKFYITDHYLNYPWVLVRMSSVTPDELRDLLIGSWRRVTTGKTKDNYGKRAR
jgi:hypothetical protein